MPLYSVTLTLKKPASLKDSLRLSIRAKPPGGVKSVGGEFLNAPSGGTAGTSAVFSFGKPAKAAKPKPR